MELDEDGRVELKRTCLRLDPGATNAAGVSAEPQQVPVEYLCFVPLCSFYLSHLAEANRINAKQQLHVFGGSFWCT